MEMLMQKLDSLLQRVLKKAVVVIVCVCVYTHLFILQILRKPHLSVGTDESTLKHITLTTSASVSLHSRPRTRQVTHVYSGQA